MVEDMILFYIPNHEEMHIQLQAYHLIDKSNFEKLFKK